MNELIIGRESGVPKEEARLAVYYGDETFFIGKKGSVPSNVSRRHCRITVDEKMEMIVDNISESNLLYINGKEYARKCGVTTADVIQLGPDKYQINLEEILKQSLALIPVYSINHLAAVYESYQKNKLDLQINQGKLNALSALPGVLSMTSIGLAVFIPTARVVMIMAAAVFALAFALVRYRNASKVPVKSKVIEESFREAYLCPNPKCHHYLGVTPYKELIKNGCCPYCKAKFKE